MLHASQFEQPVAERLEVRRPKEIAALSEGRQQRRHFRTRGLRQLLDELSRGPFAAWRLVERQSPCQRVY